MADATDRRHLARAISLAERGRGRTRPNPIVGCVVVRDGEVVGEGHHAAAGDPHAEVVALGEAGERARGATVYVSLEPCDHHGRTGPCTTALLEAGVARVVYGMADPHPEAAGGHATLDAGGVAVEGGVLADWVAAQNEVFVTATTAGRPHVVLKLAQTIDGALTVGGRRWITGRPARHRVHRLRAEADGVVVGSGTVLADDPRLDVRHVEAPAGQPRPVVLDARGRTPRDAAVVRPGAVVVTTQQAPPAWRSDLVAAGVEVLESLPGRDGGVCLAHALRALLDAGLQALLAEGGPRLARSLVRERVVDRLVVHVAVTTEGPSGLPSLAPCATATPGWSWATRRTGWRGADLEVVAVPEEDRRSSTDG